MSAWSNNSSVAEQPLNHCVSQLLLCRHSLDAVSGTSSPGLCKLRVSAPTIYIRGELLQSYLILVDAESQRRAMTFTHVSTFSMEEPPRRTMMSRVEFDGMLHFAADLTVP